MERLPLTKDQAQVEAIRRWRELPISNQTTDTAMEFGKVLLAALEFETLGDRQKIITAWLIGTSRLGCSLPRCREGVLIPWRKDSGEWGDDRRFGM
jgi:hypothetical protein